MVMRAISTTAGAMRVWPAPGEWTYDDYARLPDDGYRYEVIEGEPFMSPSPSTIHQLVLARLHVVFHHAAAATHAGVLLFAPCDVVLGRRTVVQPDLLFVSAERRDIIGPKNVQGAPDLVVEILSPSDPDHDRIRKRELYARHGVREYWIVDPAERSIEVLILGEGGYATSSRARPGDAVASTVLAGLSVEVDEVMMSGE
jgi:Uma2 family endonuclease